MLPTTKTLNDYKELLAIQEEADAANALFNKPPDVMVILQQRGAKLMVIGQVSFLVFRTRRDMFCVLYFLHIKIESKLLDFCVKPMNNLPY